MEQPMPMTRTQIYLSPDQHDHVLELAEAQCRTMAEVIREAVAEYLARQSPAADPLLDLVALGNSGVTDGAMNHDRDLYDPQQS
jgi:hypothetical protein